MQVLGWGIEGAAVATALTGFWNVGWRTSLMWRLFRIHPISRAWIGIVVVSVLLAVGSTFLDVPEFVVQGDKALQLAYALGLGGAAGGLLLGLCWATGALPELSSEVQKRLKKG